MSDEKQERAAARKPSRRRGAEPGGAIDIREALEAPVRVKRDGASRPIDPYEAMLRQHVRKSIVEKCVASIKLVLGEAEKHKLIKEPPPAATGGVFIVPKNLPESIERQIFDNRSNADGQPISFSQIVALLLTVIDFDRLKRCFSDRRD
jgi:hypothetical protein